MPIYIDLDVELAKRKMKLGELANQIGITIQNLSVLKAGRAKAIRFSTLSKICKVLACQPGDILKYTPEGDEHLLELNESMEADSDHQTPPRH